MVGYERPQHVRREVARIGNPGIRVVGRMKLGAQSAHESRFLSFCRRARSAWWTVAFTVPAAQFIATAVSSTLNSSKNRNTIASRCRSGRSASHQAQLIPLFTGLGGGMRRRFPGSILAAQAPRRPCQIGSFNHRRRRRFPHPAPLDLPGHVQGDSQRPGPQLAVAAKPRQLPQEPHRRLLNGIPGLFRITQQPQAHAIPWILEIAQQHSRGQHGLAARRVQSCFINSPVLNLPRDLRRTR